MVNLIPEVIETDTSNFLVPSSPTGTETATTHLEIVLPTFDCAHQLPNHDGKCANLHGHTYKVVVSVAGRVLQKPGDPKEGMVVDFGVIKAIYKSLIENVCDHALLIGTTPLPWMIHLLPGLTLDGTVTGTDAERLQQIGFKKVTLLPIPITTAENLAGWMMKVFQQGMSAFKNHGDVFVTEVRVYETPTACAIVKVPYNIEVT